MLSLSPTPAEYCLSAPIGLYYFALTRSRDPHDMPRQSPSLRFRLNHDAQLSATGRRKIYLSGKVSGNPRSRRGTRTREAGRLRGCRLIRDFEDFITKQTSRRKRPVCVGRMRGPTWRETTRKGCVRACVRVHVNVMVLETRTDHERGFVNGPR